MSAELRGNFYIARALELVSGDNDLSVTATDKVGKQKQYPEPPATHRAKLDSDLNVKYTYDEAGNMVTKLVDDWSTTTYTYNDANQLTQISFPGNKTRKFYYDGLGRRVKTEYTEGQNTTTRTFVYLGGSVIRELDASNPPTLVTEYIRDGGLAGGIACPLACESRPDLAAGLRGGYPSGSFPTARGSIIYCKEGSNCYYFHYNPWPGRHKGNVVALTDGTGKLAAYYQYDACLPACATLTYSAPRSFRRGRQLWSAPPAGGKHDD